jgi:hypothetical protein
MSNPYARFQGSGYRCSFIKVIEELVGAAPRIAEPLLRRLLRNSCRNLSKLLKNNQRYIQYVGMLEYWNYGIM